MRIRRWWAWLGLLGIGVGLGWWERRPPRWMLEDPLRHPFGVEFLEPEMGEDPTDAPAAEDSPPEGPVFVNWAGAEELISLPGVGAVTAQRILALRERRGFFARAEDLLEVRGIGPKTLERMRGRIRLDRSPPEPGD